MGRPNSTLNLRRRPDTMGAVRRQSARISDNVKIKKTPLKVQDKKGSTSRRGRSALADKTNQQEPEKVRGHLLDERTSKRRSKRTFEGEVDHQSEEKKALRKRPQMIFWRRKLRKK